MSKELKVPVEVYSRVSGYYRPVNNWNKGKQQEFKDRKTMDFDRAIAKMDFITRRGQK